MKDEHFTFAAAQFQPVKGDIEKNLVQHIHLIDAAALAQVDSLIFPELSLCGYELELTSSLALTTQATCLNKIAELSRLHKMTICVGAPLQSITNTPYIGLIVFAPDGSRQAYHKIHLTETEQKYCTPGQSECVIPVKNEKIGLAICADLGAPSHPESTAKLGASIYLSSVLASDDWYEKDANRLQDYAQKYKFPCGLANFYGPSGPYIANGKSAIWDETGTLIAQAKATGTALVIATKTQQGWQGRVEFI